MLEGLLEGLATVFTWPGPLLIVIGVIIGLIGGILPGLGGASTTALLIPLTFAMEPAQAIVFLLSEASAFISGSCLRVDGAAPNGRRDWDMPDHDRSRPYRGFPLESRVEFLEQAGQGAG